MRISLTILGVCLATSLLAQRAIVINSIPENTPENATLYLGASANSWNPGDENWTFDPVDSVYILSVPESAAMSFEGKVTRGDWATVEATAAGSDIGNRTFNFTSSDTLTIQVAGWVGTSTGGDDQPPNLVVLNNNFFMPQLGRSRRVRLLLPLNYDSTTIDYPVLYMHDGQNLFIASESFAGEWKVDEALATFESEGYPGAIVVAIDNGGQYRIDEYTPWANPEYGGGEGSDYIEFIVNTLKPYVDEHYRTLSDRENTGIFGSSLGGLISQYAGVKYPNIFSKVGVFSPSFWFTDDIYTFTEAQGHSEAQKFYFLGGGQESATLESDIDSMISTMENVGFQPNEINFKFVSNGAHSEWFWAQEFPEAFEWLFISNSTAVNELDNNMKVSVYPNPATDTLYLLLPENKEITDIKIYDTIGREVYSAKGNVTNVDVSAFAKGAYVLKITGKDTVGTCRFVVE